MYANPDGTWTSEIASAPESVQDESGTWHDIDPSLVQDGNRLAPKYGLSDVTVSAGGDKVFATMTEDGKDLAWKWPTVLPEPILEGPSATYAGVAADGAGDLVVTANDSGFSYNVVLHEEPTAPVEVAVPVITDGGVLKETSDGGLVVTTNDGKPVVSAPEPVMFDASANDEGDPTNVATVDVDVAKSNGPASVLTLLPDQDYLHDPDTVYPVTVDPTFDGIHAINDPLYSTDSWIQTPDFLNGQDSSQELRVGSKDAGSHKARAFMHFGGTSNMWAFTTIDSADLVLRSFDSGSCTSGVVRAAMINQAWTGGAGNLSWPGPSVAASYYSDYAPAQGYSSSCPAGDATWDVTAMVRQWAAGAANNGIRLSATDANANQSNTYRRYRSANYQNYPGLRPHLNVTWHTLPSIALAPTVAPSSYYTPPGGPSALYTSAAKPTFTSSAADGDGGLGKIVFRVYVGGSTNWYTACTGSYATPGVNAACAVPDALPDGTYTVRGKAGDYWGWAGGGSFEDETGWSTRTTFTVDTSAPSIALTATGLADNTWYTTAPTSNTFTFDGAPDTVSMTYSKDGAAPVALSGTQISSTGDANLTWLPGLGFHTLAVTATDRAGNSSSKSFSFGIGDSPSLSAPATRMKSNATFPLSVLAPLRSSGDLRLQWRYAGASAWNTIASQTAPSSGSIKTYAGITWDGQQTVDGPSQPQAASSDTFDLLWDATKEDRDPTDNSADTLAAPALLEVRGCLGSLNCTPARAVQLIDNPNAPTTSVGPMTVDLGTGDASLGGADAVDANAGVARLFASTDDATKTDGPFGKGWSASGLSAYADLSAATVNDAVDQQGSIALSPPGGSPIIFSPVGAASGGVTILRRADATDDGSRLTVNTSGSPNTLTWSAPYAGTVTWTKTSAGWGSPTASSSTGSGTTSQASSGGLLTWIAQTPSAGGVVCTASTQDPGCRGLKLTYDGAQHVTQIARVAYDPKAGVDGLAGPGAGVTTTPIATYSYDGSGRLVQACDPRPSTPLCISYEYISVNGRTLIAAETPPGQSKWSFSYDGSGRLIKVARPVDPNTNPGISGNATWTVVYGSALDAIGLPAMGGNDVARWGQTDVPTDVTAVFPPNHVPAANPTIGDWKYAQLFYTRSDGAQTNSAVFGAGQWLVDTAWYDSYGNIIQSLNGAGRSRALSAATDADRLRLAKEASSVTIFNSQSIGAGQNSIPPGSRVEATYTPAHAAYLTDGTSGLFRSRTSYTYDDEGSIAGDTRPPLPANRVNFGLIIKTTSDAVLPDLTGSFDASIVRHQYSPVVAGDGDGWTIGRPTREETQLEDGSWSTTVTRFDTEGREIERRQPGGHADAIGRGDDAQTTMTQYYTAGNPDSDCNTNGQPSKADWIGLICKQGPAGAPMSPSMPSSAVTGYDVDLQATRTVESSGTTVRTSVNVFDDLGRETAQSSSVSGGDTRSITRTYDSATGAPSSQTDTSVNASGSESQTTDSWGRERSYTDATGMTSRPTYTIDGELSTFDDGAGTYAYSYDEGSGANEDHRRLVTTVDLGLSSGPDTVTLKYNTLGAPSSVTYSNGMVASYTYDELGIAHNLKYANASGDEVVGFGSDHLVDGRVSSNKSTGSSQHYTYDALGRLRSVQDQRPDASMVTACTTRMYGFNLAPGRTSFKTYGPASDKSCQTATPSMSKSNAYDAANRPINSGYSYDNLGRTLTTPAIDTTKTGGGAPAGPLESSYFANDMIKTLKQDVNDGSGVTTKEAVYGLDASGRITNIINRSGGAETSRIVYRFSSDGDSPTSIRSSNDGGSGWATTRYLQIAGLGAIGSTDIASGSSQFGISNLHGDIVAYSPNVSGAVTISSYQEADEFGNSASGRYSYLGTQQRAADGIGGTVLMGARLYNPASGNFLTPDPIPGGNATRYGYPSDPINGADISGKFGYDMRFRLRKWAGSQFDFFFKVQANFTKVFPISGAKDLKQGAEMNLHPLKILYFPVKVSNIYLNGWRFEARRGHPDYPGGWIQFNFEKGKDGYITLVVKAHIPTFSAGGACIVAGPTCVALYGGNARYTWGKFADNLVDFFWG
ncbi:MULTISPECIES: RHS repeat-associated core domain-containing protein [unclassified Nocardioides]|uniref:RHS repeat-associated core domain-containing protein n=1 Tax=unclassified Nocardioides TaxID=2615069 RepID=UPI00138F3760|nr:MULTISPECIES: RHS repeat-associated core domain-containing protein [unclassified Nocardioides]